jgi:hypothetical protein
MCAAFGPLPMNDSPMNILPLMELENADLFHEQGNRKVQMGL